MDEKTKTEIDEMTQVQMASLHRFAPAGHPYFQRGEVSDYFAARFRELGGMTPEISKRIGWDQ
jgi:hypothetical protein